MREIKAGQPIRKLFNAEVKAVGDRTFEWIVSTANRDRDNDTIAVDGWDLKAFRKNPIILWAHAHSQPPLGTATKIWAENGALRAHIKFVREGTSQFADMIHNMVEQRVLRATSVGFIPLEWKFREDQGDRGVDFLKQELLEISCVPVPANAEALIAAAAHHGVGKVPGLMLRNHRSPSPAILNLRPDDIVLELTDDDAPPRRSGVRDYARSWSDDEAEYHDGFDAGWDQGYRAGLRAQRTRAPARTQAGAPTRAPTREPVLIDADPGQVRELVRDSVAGTLRDVIGRAVVDRIRQIRGRLD